MSSANSPKHRPGWSLLLIGLLGVAFFWVTDARYGLALHYSHDGNPIDLANQQFPGTVLGVVGSLLIFGIGAHLLLNRDPRRPADTTAVPAQQ